MRLPFDRLAPSSRHGVPDCQRAGGLRPVRRQTCARRCRSEEAVTRPGERPHAGSTLPRKRRRLSVPVRHLPYLFFSSANGEVVWFPDVRHRVSLPDFLTEETRTATRTNWSSSAVSTVTCSTPGSPGSSATAVNSRWGSPHERGRERCRSPSAVPRSAANGHAETNTPRCRAGSHRVIERSWPARRDQGPEAVASRPSTSQPSRTKSLELGHPRHYCDAGRGAPAP